MTAPRRFRQDHLDPARTTGLILCGMGGPDGPDAVQPFLRNLFRDPQIIPIPRLLSPLLGRLIAWRRAPAVRRRYLEMGHGGGSPQVPTTRAQGDRLAELLGEAGRPTVALPAMRYWRPFPDEAVRGLRERGAEQFLVLPMYPQYSDATNGSTLSFVQRSLDRLAPGAAVHVVEAWHLLDGFVATLAANAGRGLRRWADEGADPQECALIYVAHSLPESFIKRGDPYLSQTRATVSAVHERVRAALATAGHAAWVARLPGGPAPLLAFQSKVGPIKWLGPEITAETRRLAGAGCRRLLVQPVSFTCEHIETLHELDLDLQREARRLGVREFDRGAALNLDETWLASLAARLAGDPFRAEATLD